MKSSLQHGLTKSPRSIKGFQFQRIRFPCFPSIAKRSTQQHPSYSLNFAFLIIFPTDRCMNSHIIRESLVHTGEQTRCIVQCQQFLNKCWASEREKHKNTFCMIKYDECVWKWDFTLIITCLRISLSRRAIHISVRLRGREKLKFME